MTPGARAPRARRVSWLAAGGLLFGLLYGAGPADRAPGVHVAAAAASTRALGDLGATSSSNWSGYAAGGATFSDVVGSWTVPSVPCKGPVQYASVWVGMDGYSTGDKSQVEQAGTDSDCLKVKVPKGKKTVTKLVPVYFAWWEMYPGPVVTLPASSCPVSPGDVVTADVSSSSGSFTLTLSDATAGWQCASEPQSSSAPAASAEWVVEAPFSVNTGRVQKLADFGTVGFSGAQANGTPISGLSNDSITMQVKKLVKAVPSSLGDDGASFSVTWQHG